MIIVHGCESKTDSRMSDNGIGCRHYSEDEPVELFGNTPSVGARGAFESFHGLAHAVGPTEVSKSVITSGGDQQAGGGRCGAYVSQF